jgi:hypothetical protein
MRPLGLKQRVQNRVVGYEAGEAGNGRIIWHLVCLRKNFGFYSKWDRKLKSIGSNCYQYDIRLP